MARGGQRDLSKERIWRRLLHRWQRSRLSIRDFCSQHDISEACFYFWRRTLAERNHQAPPAPRQPKAVSEPPTFVPVRVVPAGAPLEVVLGNGRVVRVAAGFDAESLQQLLTVLEEPSC